MENLKINPDWAEAELCRRYFYDFIKRFWDVIIPEEFQDNWHIKYLADELQKVAERVIKREPKEYDLIINVPPGTSKSTICTIMFPVWCWVRDPSLKFITGSYSETLATQHSVKSRDLLKSDKFKRLFPGLIDFKYDSDNKTLYENTKGGGRFTTSTGGTITGMHGHILILDDPLNALKAQSETERNTANNWFSQTLSTRKIIKDVTVTIVIMQRLHENDTTGYILSKGLRIKHVCLPAEESRNISPPELREYYKNGLLDPIRLSESVLAEQKAYMGSYGYAGQFMQIPSPEEGGIIKKDWFKYISLADFEELRKKSNPTFNTFIDPAYTANKSNDPTALLSCTVIDNILYINDAVEKWLELPVLVKFIPEFTKKNGGDSRSRIYVEPKASGLSIVQTFRQSNLNVIEAPAPKEDKTTRAHGISSFIEAGKVVLIGNKNDSWIENLLAQVTQFPNAKHDDLVDVLVMACSHHHFKKYPGKYIII
jgi:predicted phage terminase large subunit-like protein